MTKKCCPVKIINVGQTGSNNVIDGVVNGGSVVGNILQLTRTLGGTVNIPLIGAGSSIDFSQLSPIQVDALSDALQGDLVVDGFGNQLGYLLPV